MKQSLLLSLLTLSILCQAQLPTSLTGNWINQENNAWEYSFFEKFAIYDGKFWNYSVLKNKDKKATIALQQGEETLLLEINQKNDSLLTIKNGKQKSKKYILMHNCYPTYTVKDNTTFPQPDFHPDSAYITGYYHNFDRLDNLPDFLKQQFASAYFNVSVPNFITDEEDEYTAPIDSLGRFFITIPTMDTQEVWVDWERLNKMAILEPGDQLFLFADMKDLLPHESDKSRENYRKRNKQILWMGNNARINNELVQYNSPQLYVDREAEVKKNISDMEYLQICENVYQQQMHYLNDYIACHPTLSEKFRLHQNKHEKYRFANNLMQHRFDLNRNIGEQFQEGYMDYVNENFPLYDKDNYTFLRDYKSFLRDYVGYAGDTGPKEVMLKTQIPLTEHVFFYAKLSLVDSLIKEPVLKDWWTASLYYDLFDNERKPLHQQEMELFNQRISNPFLRERLLQINKYYAQIEEKGIQDESSLKNTDDLAHITNPDELFNKLIEAYRGKVIYLDFWGTWCSPCRENMKLAGAIEKEVADEDIIFMYFANYSPEQTWKNVIKEMNLTGKNIVHYRLPDNQQTMLEKKLSIRQFPSYLIVNKEGKLVNTNAPSPKEKERLVSELKKLANE
ncbi:MAG: TlpA family protein disulfide reductase [Candidatus Symbiothrix sp.]|jgi:thiol-disulfide isomerase/thioredoxin|nr:TlpA family protein disulfide reductase [Candidatus Symbiothrix sp.]